MRVPQPQWDPIEIGELTKFIVNYPKKQLRIFEWGAGGSTVYFCRMLSFRPFHWTAAETDPGVAEFVQKNTDPKNADILLFDYGENDQEKLKKLPMDEYIHAATGEYDIMIVDGRHRSECIAVAKKMIAKDGTIILHDAQRKRYHTACILLDKKVVKGIGDHETWLLTTGDEVAR